MVDWSRCDFDHWANHNEGTHNGFIEVLDLAVDSPDVDTAGMKFRVSASCYRRLFAMVPIVL